MNVIFSRTIPNRLLPILCVVALGGCFDGAKSKRDAVPHISDHDMAFGAEQYARAQDLFGGSYQVDPVVNAYVNGVGHRIASASRVRMPFEFVVYNNPIPNAWGLPGGKVGISHSLLMQLRNEAELAAVLAHGIAQGLMRRDGAADSNGSLEHVSVAPPGSSRQEYIRSLTVQSAAGVVLLSQRLDRADGEEADRMTVAWLTRAGYAPAAAPDAQETLLSAVAMSPDSWRASIMAAHPPSPERVEVLQALAAVLESRGELGTARFADATRGLASLTYAYGLADRAHRALAEARLDSALTYADAALALVPNDAALHTLRGDVQMRLRAHDQAIASYTQALRLRGGDFALHASRGIAHARLGARDAARADLQHSLALLPTAIAYHELGRMAEFEGDLRAAMRYYQAASESSSPAGRSARARFVGMDLPRNPGQYLAVRIVDQGGYPALQVANLSDVELLDVNVRVQLEWYGGAVDDLLPSLSELGAEQHAVVALPLRDIELTAARAFPLTARTRPPGALLRWPPP